MTEPTHGPFRVPISTEGPTPAGSAGEYEYRVITLPAWITRAQARQQLTEHAEYGHWELARVRLYAGGARRIWLRRKIIRVVRTA